MLDPQVCIGPLCCKCGAADQLNSGDWEEAGAGPRPGDWGEAGAGLSPGSWGEAGAGLSPCGSVEAGLGLDNW